jgi:hypothetical protein
MMFRRFLILVFVLLIAAGCDNGLDRPIHFRIPAGFSGPFVIVSDPKYSDIIRVKPDRYEILVPENGVIYTNNVAIIYRWHQITATDSDGIEIPWPTEIREASSGGSGPVRRITWFFVGSYDESKAFMYSGDYAKQSKWLEERGVSY